MTRFAYFADLATGSTVEFRDTVERREDRFGMVRTREVPAKVGRDDKGNLRGYVEGLGWVNITRTVEMKANPSKHVCDAKCVNATGRVMKCECSCGGKNHGRGASFICEAA